LSGEYNLAKLVQIICVILLYDVILKLKHNIVYWYCKFIIRHFFIMAPNQKKILSFPKKWTEDLYTKSTSYPQYYPQINTHCFSWNTHYFH